jgi:dihydroorotase
MRKILIRGGRIVDPAGGRINGKLDLLLAEGRIAEIDEDITPNGAEIIDASGCIVTPGLVDMHTHFREPGQEHKETIKTGSRAAARGGFTSVATMANTDPVVDSPKIVEDIIYRAKSDSSVNIFPIAGVTSGLKGEKLVDVERLIEAGAVGLSDDGNPVRDPEIMRQALTLSKEYRIPVISHCEDPDKTPSGWVMNEGEISSKLGLTGAPNSAEEIMLARDIKIAEDTGGYLHIAHVSTAGSVELIKRAKEKSINITAEATPHHFSLTDRAVVEYGSNAKMNPPLRSEKDVEAMINGLKDGTIDVIATDHAPHAPFEKNAGIEQSPFGIVGLETCVPLAITQLLNKGFLNISDLIAKLTINPSQILNLNKGTLKEGADADVTLINLDHEWEIKSMKFESKGRNTPFEGWVLKGLPVMTIVGGEIVYTRSLKDGT